MHKKYQYKGFTLLEILLVITLIGILASIALVAINPNRQLAQARNLIRKSDIDNIYKALEIYKVRNSGNILSSIDEQYKEICDTGTRNLDDGLPSTNYCDGKVDLRSLVPNYILSVPKDSQETTPGNTGYQVAKTNTGQISIKSTKSELSETIAINIITPKLIPDCSNLAYNSTSKKITIPYTGGLVGFNYTTQTINSVGITGLTATLTGGTLSSSGNLEYTVTGSPSGAGAANFNINNISNTFESCNNNIAVNVTETAADPYYNNVSLLLRNGAGSPLTPLDQSPTEKTITAFGNASITTAVARWNQGSGGSSMVFDGTDDRLTLDSSNDFAFGTGDFTIELWIRSEDVSGSTQRGILQISQTAGGLSNDYTGGVMIYQGRGVSVAQTGAIAFFIGGSFVGSPVVLTVNTWHHVALTRAGSTCRMFVDGTQVSTLTSSLDITASNLVVGGRTSTSGLYKGYIDDLRITKGIARYETGTGANAGKMVFAGTNTPALPTSEIITLPIFTY